jgi:hypothetical protein
MSRLRKLVVPHICQVLWLLFAVAFAADDIIVQGALLSVTPNFNQALCNGEPSAPKDHDWRVFKYIWSSKNDAHLPNLVIRTYLHQAARLLISSQPDMSFRPDRAPPVSLQ